MPTPPEAYNSLEAYKTKASELEKKKEAVIEKPDSEEHQKLSAEIDLTLEKLERDMNTSEVLADSTVKQGFLNVQTQLTNMKNAVASDVEKQDDETPDELLKEDKKRYEKIGDWTKENRNQEGWKGKAKVIGTGAGVVAGGVLLYKGIRSLWNWAFGKKDKKKEEEKSDGKKGEKTPRYKKSRVWLMGVLGIGGVALYKNREAVANFLGLSNKEKKEKMIALGKEIVADGRFATIGLDFDEKTQVFTYRGKQKGLNKILKITSDGTAFDKEATIVSLQERISEINRENPELPGYSKTKEFLEKNPDIHQLYSSLGDKVNAYKNSLGSNPEPLGGAGYEKVGDQQSTGLLVAQLGESFFDVQQMFNQGSWKNLEQQTNISVIMKFLSDALKTGATWALEGIRDSLPNTVDNSLLNAVNNGAIDVLNNGISNLNQTDKDLFKNNLKQVFRKWINIIQYMEAAKNAYQYRLIEKFLIAQDPSFVSKNEKEKTKLIQKKMQDEVFLRDHIQEEMKNFTGMNLRNLLASQDEDIRYAFDYPYTPVETLEEIEDLQKDEDQLLGRLNEVNKNSPNEIKDIAEDLVDEIDSKGYMKWHTIRSTALGGMFKTDTYQINMMIDSQNIYQDIIGPVRTIAKEIAEKSHPTPDDYSKLQGAIKDYYETQKNLLTQLEFYNGQDEEGGFFTNFIVPVREGEKKSWKMICLSRSEGKYWTAGLTALSTVLGTGVALDPILWGPRKIKQAIQYAKGTTNTLKLTISPTDYILRKGIGKPVSILARNMQFSVFKNAYYQHFFEAFGADGAKLVLRHDVLTSKISYDKALKVANKVFKITDQEFLSNVLKIDGANATLYQEISTHNPEFIKKLLYRNNNVIAANLRPNALADKIAKGDIGFEINRDVAKKYKELLGKTDIRSQFMKSYLEQVGKVGKGKEALTKLTAATEKLFPKNSRIISGLMRTTPPTLSMDDLVYVATKHADKLAKVNQSDLSQLAKIMKTSPKPDLEKVIVNRSKIKQAGFNLSSSEVKPLHLSETSSEVAMNRCKSIIRNCKNALNKVRGTTPYQTSVNNSIRNLSILERMPVENWSALTFGVGKDVEWIRKLGQNPRLLAGFRSFLNNPQYTEQVKLLGKAKTGAEVKTIFNGTPMEELIKGTGGDELVENLAKTKYSKNMKALVEYAKNFEKRNKGVMKLRNVLRSPAFRYIGRALMKTLGIVGIPLAGFDVYHQYQEGSELIDTNTNVEHGELKHEEAIVSGILYGVGIGLMFIPGVGWIAGGVIIAGTMAVDYFKHAYYETVGQYYTNYKELLEKASLYSKAHILSITAGQKDYNRNWKEGFARVFSDTKMSYLADKTGGDAMKAMLYLDEYKRNPIAMVNMDDRDVMSKLEERGMTRQQIGAEKDTVEKRVQERFDYLKLRLGYVQKTDKQKLNGKEEIQTNDYLKILDKISKADFDAGRGFEIIERYLNESLFMVDNPDAITYEQMQAFESEMEDKLKQSPYDKLPKLSTQQVMYYYQYRETCKTHLEEQGQDDPEKEQILTNIVFIEKYIQYRVLKGDAMVLKDEKFVAYPVDYTELRNFFVDFSIQPMQFTEATLSEAQGLIQNTLQLSESLYISANPMQNVLYRIVTEVLDKPISNTKEDIQASLPETDEYEKKYGLYFNKDGKLCINKAGTFSKDVKFDWNADIRELRKTLTDLSSKSDLVERGSGNEQINKAIARKYLTILDQEIEILNNRNTSLVMVKKYIETSSNGTYVRLPLSDVIILTKLGIENAGNYVYKREDGKIIPSPTTIAPSLEVLIG